MLVDRLCEEKTRSSSSFSVAGVGVQTQSCVRTFLSYLASDILTVLLLLLTLYSLIIIYFLCYLYVSLRI